MLRLEIAPGGLAQVAEIAPVLVQQELGGVHSQLREDDSRLAYASDMPAGKASAAPGLVRFL